MSSVLSTTLTKESQSITAYMWWLFLVCFIGNVLGGIASTLMSVYLPVVAADLLGQEDPEKLTKVAAIINALYFVGWAFGGLTWGFIADRIGRARSLALCTGMFGLFTVLIGIAPSWEWVLICRILCGFGVGGLLVINTTLLSEVWPEWSRAIFIGILSIGFPVGIFSSGAINYFVSGWRNGFSVGLLPLGLAVVAWLTIKESEKWKIERESREMNNASISSKVPPYLVGGSVIFGSMLIGLWAVFSWVPTWVGTLVQDGNGQQERSLSMMMLGAGGLSGGFFSGWIANVLGIRKSMLTCFAGCFALSLLLFKGNTSFAAITLIEIAALAFMFGISQGLLSVYIPMLFSVPVRARATGFCFNVGRFFTAAAVFFVGVLVTTLGGYGNSLVSFSFVFLIGFFFLLASKNT